MVVRYTNRRDKEYYLHKRTSKTGTIQHYFSMDATGELVDAIPEGYEIYEHPNGQVFLRRADKVQITDEEVSLVEKGVRRHTELRHFLVDKKPKEIVILTPGQTPESLTGFLERLLPGLGAVPDSMMEDLLSYLPMMRFTLVDKKRRLFQPERYCFRGRIDDWIEIGRPDRLERLVETYVHHLDADSFYELF